MKLQLPHFVSVRTDGTPGERAFVQKLDDGSWLWIIVVPNQKDDSFTLELGWSALGRDPREGRPPQSSPQEALREAEYICRIGQLFGNDFWWHFDGFMRTPEAKVLLGSMPGALQSDPVVRVRICTAAAMDALVKFGLPYLDARAAAAQHRV